MTKRLDELADQIQSAHSHVVHGEASARWHEARANERMTKMRELISQWQIGPIATDNGVQCFSQYVPIPGAELTDDQVFAVARRIAEEPKLTGDDQILREVAQKIIELHVHNSEELICVPRRASTQRHLS